MSPVMSKAAVEALQDRYEAIVSEAYTVRVSMDERVLKALEETVRALDAATEAQEAARLHLQTNADLLRQLLRLPSDAG